MRLSSIWPQLTEQCCQRFSTNAIPKTSNVWNSPASLLTRRKSLLTTTHCFAAAISAINPSIESNKMNDNLFNLMKRYEDIIGLTDVKRAQMLVLQAERDFTKTQELRREKQDEIRDLQMRLKEIHVELDKTSRGEDRYLNLLTQEHAIIKKEKILVDEFKRLEHSERLCFNALSARLRESHEKERERGERTKYWSIIGSIIGAVLGILGTTISNRLRVHDFKRIVQETSEPGKFQAIIAQLTAMIQAQQQQIAVFVADLNSILNNRVGSVSPVLVTVGPTTEGSSPQGEAILSALKEQDEKLGKEMAEVKQLIAAEHAYKTSGDGDAVVYVGPKMEQLLDQTEKNLEMKIKINTLVNVVAFYAALAITVPILYAIFRGG